MKRTVFTLLIFALLIAGSISFSQAYRLKKENAELHKQIAELQKQSGYCELEKTDLRQKLAQDLALSLRAHAYAEQANCRRLARGSKNVSEECNRELQANLDVGKQTVANIMK